MTDPNKNVVTSLSGITLNNVDPTKEYQISLDLYGEYSVVYTATDTEMFNPNPNKATYSYVISVLDDVVPEVKFNANFKTTVKVGETMVIPSFTVSDNVTAAENIRVMKCVWTPNGELLSIPENSNSVKAMTAGVYEFRIIAVDAVGNMSISRVKVTVE